MGNGVAQMEYRLGYEIDGPGFKTRY
jgi:hypothetical protein